jgi:hypothetical protein
MRPEDVRHWARGRRAAEERDLDSRGLAADPRAAWRQALSLFALLDRMVGWPVPQDDVRRREDRAAAQAWTKLRAAHRRQP